MDLNELKQYENVNFSNFEILQKTIKYILEAFRHLKELHIKNSVDDVDIMQLVELNQEFNDLVNIITKESLKMSMDLEDFIEYFRMLTEGNVTVNELLQTLLVLKDVSNKRIIDYEELKEKFENFKISVSILKDIVLNISQSPGSCDDDDDEVEDAQRKPLLQITDGNQPLNLRSALYQILLEFIKPTLISVSAYFLLPWIVPEKWYPDDKLKKIEFSSFGGDYSPKVQSSSQSIVSKCLALVVFSGYYIYKHKVISRKVKDLMNVVKRDRFLSIFNRRNDITIMNDEREQKKSKYKENISKKLSVILIHLEILIQFWKQQVDIFESHINALQSMDGNMNLRLSNNSVVGIIKKCIEEKIHCKECSQILSDCILNNSFFHLD